MNDTRVADKTKVRINELMAALGVGSGDVWSPADCNEAINKEYADLGRACETRLRTFEQTVMKAPDPGATALYFLGAMTQAVFDAMIQIGNMKELRDLLKKRSDFRREEES